jgi:transcriptional regulator
MYVPTSFRVEDEEVLADFIGRYGFATLVTAADGSPFATHLPITYDRDGGKLVGHMARANPQWRAFEAGGEVLVMFQGPHAYVSPSYYASDFAVPTWNYAAVHVYGVAKAITEEEQLGRIVDRYESGRSVPWRWERKRNSWFPDGLSDFLDGRPYGFHP